MRTTVFGKRLIQAAEEVLQIEYRAGARNKFGEKLEAVVQEYDSIAGTRLFTGRGRQQPDYCGITVSVIIGRALQAYNGDVNTYRSASAKWFKDNARRFNLRVDKIPRNGCLFLTKRSGGSGYHIGFVWEVSPDSRTIKTIEGNTWSGSSFHVLKSGCRIKLGANEYGILSRARPVNRIDSFIHIEEMFGDIVMDFPKSAAMLADQSEYSGAYCSWEDYDANAEGGEDINTAGEKFLGFIPNEYKTVACIGGGVLAVAIVVAVARNRN